MSKIENTVESWYLTSVKKLTKRRRRNYLTVRAYMTEYGILIRRRLKTGDHLSY